MRKKCKNKIYDLQGDNAIITPNDIRKVVREAEKAEKRQCQLIEEGVETEEFLSACRSLD